MVESQSPGISDLPENCISHILSLTTPLDVCRLSAVCSIFRSAANSDYVWGRMLPPDYREILSRSVSPVEFLSKKQLYFRLCSPILIDSGRKSFSLERLTGRKCYMLSARELWITWGDDSRYWQWISLPESRFQEAAELMRVCWLEIQGKLNVRALSPRTRYVAHLVFRNINRTYGFMSNPVELSLSFKDHVTTHNALLSHNFPRELLTERRLSWTSLRRLGSLLPFNTGPKSKVPREWAGNDRWMEVEIGEFFTGDGDGEVMMRVMEVHRGNWKGGIAIEGIEIRPKNDGS